MTATLGINLMLQVTLRSTSLAFPDITLRQIVLQALWCISDQTRVVHSIRLVQCIHPTVHPALPRTCCKSDRSPRRRYRRSAAAPDIHSPAPTYTSKPELFSSGGVSRRHLTGE